MRLILPPAKITSLEPPGGHEWPLGRLVARLTIWPPAGRVFIPSIQHPRVTHTLGYGILSLDFDCDVAVKVPSRRALEGSLQSLGVGPGDQTGLELRRP